MSASCISTNFEQRVDLIPFAGVKDSGGPRGPEIRDAGNDRGALITINLRRDAGIHDGSDVLSPSASSRKGVTKVFGQCGTPNYALIDACHRSASIHLVSEHEQMAAHAADALLPRLSHKLAVLNVICRPA
jgi:hypothetical protein